MSLHILIADDEPIIRIGLNAMLRDLGHRATAAANGREALQMARRQPFDLAILDVKMPYTDGLQAAATLARTSPMPIIVLTAFSEQDLIEKASDLPIHGYLVKPVQERQLAAAISIACKRFAEAQSAQEQKESLARKLAERKLLARAKGRLMEEGLSEVEAYALLQRRARSSRRTLSEIAEEVLAR